MEMVRYCPVCDDEFRPDVTVCSDCGTTLILQKEGLGADGLKSAGLVTDEDGETATDSWRTALDVLPVSNLLPIRTFDALRDLEPAVSALADAQLPSRVLVQNGRYLLLIRPDDLASAQEALDLAHADPAELEPPGNTTFDSVSGRYSHCPACGSPLPKDIAGACPECGLELSAPSGSVATPEVE
jgi:predicted nucleic acid-binding Zn ribbon protein